MYEQVGKKICSMIVKHAAFLITDAYSEIITDGAVAIDGNCIIDVGTTDEILGKYSSSYELDANRKIVMPGLVDTHNHLGNWNFYTVTGIIGATIIEQPARLLNVIYPAYTLINEGDCYDINMMGYLNAIKTGTTTVANSFVWPDEIGRGAVDSGLRVDLAPCLHQAICHSDSKGPEDDLLRTEKMIQRWHNASNERIKYRIHPEITFYCEEWFFEECAKMSAKYQVGLGTHAAEDVTSTQKAAAIWPEGEIHKMERLGFMGPNTIMYHSCVLNEEELDIYASTGTAVAHCPISNLKRGLIASVPEMLKRGIRVGLGTDYPNNDLFNVMRETSLIHTVKDESHKGVSAQQSFDLATQGGADALGIGDNVGSIHIGKKADIITLEATENTRLFPLNTETVINLIRINGAGCDVSDVIVDGILLMKDRHILHLDEEEILRNGRRCQDAFHDKYEDMRAKGIPFVKARMPELLYLAPSYKPSRRQ